MNDFETPVFRSLDLSRASRFSRVVSAIVHVTLAVCLIAIPYAGVVTEAPRRYTAVPLFVPPAVAPPPVVPVRLRPVVAAPRQAAKTFTPPVPSPIVRPAQLEPIEAPEIALSRAPERKFELPALPSAAPPVRVLSKAPIVTDTFEAGHATSLQPTQPARDLKLGGFDSAPASGRSGGRGTSGVAAAGFDSSPVSGKAGGKGTSGVASAGFDNNSSGDRGSSAGSGTRAVAPAGFGSVQPATAPVPVAKAPAPQITPVEISFKPEPVYTPDARRRRIEGEVQLEVNFGAAGQITILRVVRGLDPGLDESARSAAAQMRFRPATRDGIPIDMRGVVHIVFKLS